VTNADFTGGNYANNPLAVTGAPTGTVAAFYIPATPLPTVITKTFDLRLAALPSWCRPMSRVRTTRSMR
jgi:hypothetical protein